MIRPLKVLIILVVVVAWLILSMPMLMVLVLGPVYMINGWMGGSVPLTILFFDGYFAAQWLLIKPLMKLDTKVRDFNEAARNKSNTKTVVRAGGG